MLREPVSACGAPAGFILLDSRLNPVVVNRVAAEVLSFPQKPESSKRFEDSLMSKIRTTLFSRQSDPESPLVSQIQSGRRRYSCRSFRVDSGLRGDGHVTIAIVLERGASQAASIAQASEKYHLTVREQEVLRFLLEGLTSKEIGERMKISPHTVKAFLRLIMIKMGVTTRSGIVSKAVIPET
jgi:DNA-binding CsgD family transcriptional regulator